jgi:oligosaccharide repeat unit polymerase
VLTPVLGWVIGLGFFILAPLTIIVLNGGYEIPSFYAVSDRYARVNLSDMKYFIPFLVIWMSLLLSFMAVVFCIGEPDEQQKRREVILDESRLMKAILITAGLALLDYAATIRMVGGLETFLLSHWYDRQMELVARLGDWYVLYAWLSQANQILFTAAAALFMHSQVRRGKASWRLSMLILLYFLLQIVMLGNRIFFALFLLSFAASCWVYHRKRLITILLIVAPAVALVFSAWAYFRHNLTSIGEDVPTYLEGDLGNRAVTSLMDTFEGNDTMILFHIINDFGSKWDFMYGASYTRVVFFWIPRKLFPQKPAGFAGQIAALYEPGEPTSLNATALGEMYANFGFLSVLMLPLFTIGTFHFDRLLTSRRTTSSLFSATTFLIFIWLARSSFSDNVITLLIATLLIYLLRLEKNPRRSIGYAGA